MLGKNVLKGSHAKHAADLQVALVGVVLATQTIQAMFLLSLTSALHVLDYDVPESCQVGIGMKVS